MNYIDNSVKTFVESFTSWGPQLLQALIILSIGVTVAFSLRFLSRKLIRRYSRDHKKIGQFMSSTQVFRIAEFLAKFVFWITIIVFTTLSFSAFNINILAVWTAGVADFVPKLISATIVFLLGLFVSRFLRIVTLRSASQLGIGEVRKIANLLYFFGISIAGLIAVKQIGVDVEFLTSFVLLVFGCLLFSGAISFGFGSAPIVTNILASYYLRRIIQKGSKIKLDDVEAELIDITATSLVLRSNDKQYIIPAKKIAESTFEVKV